MMDSQSHWFQLAKELTAGSRTLIEMIIRSNSGLASERKFLRIKRKIERYEKMLQKELDELMNQSQDISLFEKHSINEISYTGSIVPSYSHRNIPLLQID